MKKTFKQSFKYKNHESISRNCYLFCNFFGGGISFTRAREINLIGPRQGIP